MSQSLVNEGRFPPMITNAPKEFKFECRNPSLMRAGFHKIVEIIGWK
ncbi:MAG: hypothetical protein ACP5HI_02490 [Caldimicrobium sp.]